MHILIVNWRDLDHHYGGGAEQYLLGLARICVAQGHQVSWICGQGRGQSAYEEVEGIKFYRRGGKFSVYPWSWWSYLRLKDKPDVIADSENGIPFFMPIISRVPVLLMIHHVHTDVWKRECGPFLAMFGSWVERRVMPKVYAKNWVSTISKSSEDMVRELFPKNPIHIIYPSIDVPCRVGQRSERPELFFIGRLQNYKSVDVLLRVMHRLKQYDCTLNIAGQGRDEARLKALCDDLELKNVNFLGFISDEQKIEMMRKAWLFLNPSSMEGWGITNIEANACGVSVLGADVPGTRDSVKDGESGWLLPHGDVDAWALKVEELITHPEKLDAQAEICLAWAEQFTWEVSATKFIKLFDDLIT